MKLFRPVLTVFMLLTLYSCEDRSTIMAGKEVVVSFSTGDDDECNESPDNKSSSRPPKKGEVRTSVFGWNGDDYRNDPYSAVGIGRACFDLRAVPSPYKAIALSPNLLQQYGISGNSGTFICARLDDGTVIKGPVLSVTHVSYTDRVDIYTWPKKDESINFKRVVQIKKIGGSYSKRVPRFDCENPKLSKRTRATGQH
jgi:hypothetical protein